MFKKLLNRMTQPVLPSTVPACNPTNNTYTVNVPTSVPNIYSMGTAIANSMGTAIAGGNVTVGNITAAAAAPNPAVWGNMIQGNIGIAGGGFGGFTFNVTPPTHIIQLSNSGSEIVRLNTDGSVTWANGIQIDEAAEAFAKSISVGAELCAGITKRIKLEMRDSVFEDIINIAREKGSLTAEDLTYLLEASKIVEKLKGGK